MTTDRQAQVDAFMEKLSPRWRYRWCNADLCGCLGCVNVSGHIGRSGFTKEDWQDWGDRNPKPPSEYKSLSFVVDIIRD